MARIGDVFWRKEGPTWLVLMGMVAGWSCLVIFHQSLPWYAVVIFGGLITALHASLTHESVHCMRSVPGWLRVSLFFLPLGVWYPYFMYVRAHTVHHRDACLTDPGRDPESFYFEAEKWSRLAPALKMVMVANQTFAGRMILGPFIAIIELFAGEIRSFRLGQRNIIRPWLLHLAGLAVLFGIVSGWAGMPWWQYIVLFAYPGLVFSLIRSFIEHRWDEAPGHRTAIVESGRFFSLLFLNNNLHVVHHRYPAMKWYEIPGYYRQHRSDILDGNGGFVFSGYGDVIRRYLFKPTFIPVRPPLEG